MVTRRSLPAKGGINAGLGSRYRTGPATVKAGVGLRSTPTREIGRPAATKRRFQGSQMTKPGMRHFGPVKPGTKPSGVAADVRYNRPTKPSTGGRIAKPGMRIGRPAAGQMVKPGQESIGRPATRKPGMAHHGLAGKTPQVISMLRGLKAKNKMKKASQLTMNPERKADLLAGKAKMGKPGMRSGKAKYFVGGVETNERKLSAAKPGRESIGRPATRKPGNRAGAARQMQMQKQMQLQKQQGGARGSRAGAARQMQMQKKAMMQQQKLSMKR